MSAYFAPKRPIPRLLFAAGRLSPGSGGIAELSRQAFKALVELHRAREICLQVRVLEDSGPQRGDLLFEDHDELPEVLWYGGHRWKFALGLLFARVDVQLFDHVGLGRLAGWFCTRMGQQYIVLIHGVEIWKTSRPDYLRTACGARMLIANSEYTAKRARARFPQLPEIRVCWPGKDEVEQSMGSERHWADVIGPHAMLIVGRLDAGQRHKGHDHLIEAMPSILETVPDAQLIIVGEGDDRRRLEEMTSQFQLSDNVLFTGWLNEAQLHGVYSNCAMFVMPSEGDGFGLVFLEAMMHRLTCVGLRHGAAAEIFENEHSGLLVDREDRKLLAAHLAALLVDDPRRSRLGQAGYLRYRELFQGLHYSERLRTILTDAVITT